MKLRQLIENSKENKALTKKIDFPELLKMNEKDLEKIKNGNLEDLEKLAKEMLVEWGYAIVYKGKGFKLLDKVIPRKENVALALYNHFSNKKRLSEAKLRTILQHTKEEGTDYLTMLQTKESQDSQTKISAKIRQVLPKISREQKSISDVKYRNKEFIEKT